ncbi:MAG: hypothetical protein AAGK17_07455 [Pseudomonadota bacterium]
MVRRILTCLMMVLLSACASYPDISQSRSPCRLEPGGWCDFVREGALEAYPYAIAATQAYTGDDDVFLDIGSKLRPIERLPILEKYEDKGFGYQLFEQFERSADTAPKARILAFRGTDFDGLTDIFYGTLRNDQIEIAVRTFEAEAARFTDDVPWIVTGHSLGGALATEVSIKYPEVRAYMFNTSPFYGGEDMQNDMRRTVFNERGEVLRRFRKFDAAPAADLFTVNCSPQKGTFYKHKIRPLADCITWIAAYEDEEAGHIVAANAITKPMVECGPADKPHPGADLTKLSPCVHMARQRQN